MKSYKLMTIGIFLAGFAMLSQAEEKAKLAPPVAPMQHGNMAMHQGMVGMMANMTEEQKSQHMKAMQEHLLQMHDLSNQILAEKDAGKKEQLKAQQLQLMKAHHSQMMEMHHSMKPAAPATK